MGKGKASKISKSQEIIKDLDSSDTFDNSDNERSNDGEETTFEIAENDPSQTKKYFFVDELVKVLNFDDPTKVRLSCIGFFDNGDNYSGYPVNGHDNLLSYKFYIYYIGDENYKEFKRLDNYNIKHLDSCYIGVSVFLDKETDKNLISCIDNQQTKAFYRFKCGISENKKLEYGKYRFNLKKQHNLLKNVKIKENDNLYTKKILKAYNSKIYMSNEDVIKHFEKQGGLLTMDEIGELDCA